MGQIHDEEIGDYLHECLQIKPEDISDEFTRLPGDIAYWNAKYTAAYRAMHLAKVELEHTRARIDLETRQLAEDTGTKITEKKVEALVEINDEYQAARVAFVEADAARIAAYGHLEAVRTKRDMTQSLGSFLREEMRGDPAVREMVAGSRAVRGS